jgi:anti-sigma factor RsiW
MNCQEFLPLAHAYSDGELDLSSTLDLERHMAQCPTCSREYQQLKSLKAALNPAALYFNAPPSLERQVRHSLKLDVRKSEPTRNWFSWWSSLAVGAACFAALGMVVWFTAVSGSNERRLAQEVVSDHVRSLMVDHQTDVLSSDQHTVKPWFDGKLDFAPPVSDLAEHGYPLQGGRLDYLQSRPVAALVYQRHKHLINVFIWPAEHNSETGLKARTFHGYNLVSWTKSGMTFWAVSDLNGAELGEFARLLKQ